MTTRDQFIKILILSLSAWSSYVVCQGKCETDSDCNEAQPCCSSFGYCGKGEGFCIPATRRGPESRKTGAGCSLEDTEFVGGDIPRSLGGGGIKLDIDSAESCFARCDENPFCKWYTYDETDKLCFMKNSRGLLRRNTNKRFISGATFRDGCEDDGRSSCASPVHCLRFHHQPISHSRAGVFCHSQGGQLARSYEGYSWAGDELHWVRFGNSIDACYACRPTKWSEVIQVPCEQELRFACQPGDFELKESFPPVDNHLTFSKISRKRRKRRRYWNPFLSFNFK